jgi:hypothetical protein
LSLWGGQPSSDVTVQVYDNTRQGAMVGSSVFTPDSWMDKKVVDFLTSSASAIDLTRDLTISVVSADALYASSGLVLGIIGENLVAEKPRLIAPDLAVFQENANAYHVPLASNFGSPPRSATSFTLIPDDPTAGSMIGSLDWESGGATLILDDAISWVGTESFRAIGKVNDEDVVIRVNIKNFGNNSLGVSGPETISERDEGFAPATFRLDLASPAGEDISIGWQVRTLDGGTSPDDFAQSLLPAGVVNFARGETSKHFTINIAGDAAVETDEKFEIILTSLSSAETFLSIPRPIVAVIENNDHTTFSGTARYWKDDKPVNLVGGFAIDSAKDLDSLGACQIKNISYDRALGELKAEVWLNASESISNFDFRISKLPGVVVSETLSDELTGWSIVKNSKDDLYAIAGLGGATEAGPIKLMDISFRNVSAGDKIVLQRGAIGDFEIGSQDLFKSGSVLVRNGAVEYEGQLNQMLKIEFSGAATPGTLASLDSRDALMCLKMANGSLSAADIESPYQFIAADVNKSGQVTAVDAFLLLRAIVGLDSVGSAGQWQCVNAAADPSGLSAGKAWDDSFSEFENRTPQFDLTGVILGDVDGSWSLFGWG